MCDHIGMRKQWGMATRESRIVNVFIEHSSGGDNRKEDEHILGVLPPANQLADIPINGGDDNPVLKDPDTRKESQNWWDLLIPTPGDTNPILSEQQGVCIGEALPPVPEKLVNRIYRWQFIDMAELLPEAFVSARAPSQMGPSAVVYQKWPATNVLIWVQCFGVYVGILAKQFPDAVPELMSYMISIIKASKNYEGLAWVNYDTLYCRWAAATNCRKWSQINLSLFSLCFTGKAQGLQHCDLCGDTAHMSSDCVLSAEREPDLVYRLKALENRVQMIKEDPHKGPGQVMRRNREVCNLYNKQQCKFYYCKYRHVCSGCGGNHPVLLCRLGNRSGAPPAAPNQRRYKPY